MPGMPRRTASKLAGSVLMLAMLGNALAGAAAAQERTRIEIVPLIAHAGGISAAAFSRDGAHVLSGGRDGTLKLWDVATTRLVRTFVGHRKGVTAVALSPDGTRALSGSEDKTIRLWEVATGRLIRTIYAHVDSSNDGVSAVAFSPDGRHLLSASKGESMAKLWNAETGRLVRMYDHGKGAWRSSVTTAAFSPDGTRIATGGSGDKMVSVWNTETGQLVQAFGDPPESFIYRVKLAISPDGSRVLVGDNGTLRLWDMAKGVLLHTLGSHGLGEYGAATVEFSPDGSLALTSSYNKGLQLWSVQTGELVRTFKPKLSTHIVLSADGTRALGQEPLGESGGLQLWDLASGELLRTFRGRSASVGIVAASPDGARLLTGDNKVRLWDAASGRLARTINELMLSDSAIVFSPDSARLLSTSYNAIKLWDAQSGELVREIKSPPASKVAYSADGSKLLAFVTDSPAMQPPKADDKPAVRGSAVIAWDAATGQPVRGFKLPMPAVGKRPAAFSPDTTRFLLPAPEYDKPLEVWDVASGKMLHAFGGRATNFVKPGAFTPDGGQVALGHDDGSLKLWDVASGNVVRTVWHSKSVQAIAFSRDGSRMLTGSDDTTAKLWETATGRLVRTFEGHSSSVRSVAFSPDEKRIITGSQDTTARVWNAETGEQLAVLLASRGDEWLVITPEGFFDASPQGAEMLTVARGLEVFGIDQFYQTLYRPDLVREKLAGDPDGKVRAAAARLDLGKLVDSGRVPYVAIVSHKAQETTPEDRVTLEAEIVDQGGGIGRVEWRINGVTVGVVEKPAAGAPGRPVAVSQVLALDPGENTVEIVAYNAANLVASVPARARITWTGTEPSVPPRLYVVAVGINEYLDSALKLRFAVPDATALGNALSEAGSGHYESVVVTSVLDQDATAARLDQVFADLSGKVRPRDVFAFFAAGHGKTVDGRYYFIPYDLRYQTDETLVRDAIGQDRLQAWFARILAKKAVLMFDTCEAGSLTQRVATRGGLEQKTALGRLIQATGRATLTASSASQVAFEGHGGHGVFTFALLDALARGDVNGNGLVELVELIQHVDGLVPAITEKRWGARQFPQMDAFGANFALARQVPTLAPAQDEAIIVPARPTHVSTEPLPVFKEAGGSAVVQELPPFTSVTLVKSEHGWVLIARDGKLLGYAAESKLHKLN